MSRKVHRAATGACFLFALAPSGTSFAADDAVETASLSYTTSTSSAQCPDEESFGHHVAARLGYQPFAAPGKHRVSLRLVERSGRLYGHAEINRASGARGVRDLESGVDGCEALVAALAIAVAIAIDPVRSARQVEEPARSSASEPPPPASPPPSPPPLMEATPPATSPREAPAPQREPSASPAIFATGSVIAAVGLLPDISLGGAVGVGVRSKAISVELSGRAETLPGHARSSAGDRLDASAFSGVLAACGHLDRVSACGTGRVGALQARGLDTLRSRPNTIAFGTVGARIAYTQPLHQYVALRVLVSAEAPLVPTSFIIDDTSVWTAPPVMAALEAGALFPIP